MGGIVCVDWPGCVRRGVVKDGNIRLLLCVLTPTYRLLEPLSDRSATGHPPVDVSMPAKCIGLASKDELPSCNWSQTLYRDVTDCCRSINIKGVSATHSCENLTDLHLCSCRIANLIANNRVNIC